MAKIITNDSNNKRNAKYVYNKYAISGNIDKINVTQFKNRYNINSNNFIIYFNGADYTSWEFSDVVLANNVRYAIVKSGDNIFKCYYNGNYIGEARYINAHTSTSSFYVCNLE